MEHINAEIKNLMLEAIRYERPDCIQKVCLPIWNQPFFYKIDKARALTISYNPTDRGARINYSEVIDRYKRNGFLEAEEIFDLLYTFKKENKWRKCYDLLFNTLGIASENIAHMDVSFFPYQSFNDYLNNKHIDNTHKFLRKTVELLSDNLEYILIDGAKNRDIVNYFIQEYVLIDRSSLSINSGKPHGLYIYKHKSRSTFLIYYACFLYGQTCPSENYVRELANYISAKVNCIKEKEKFMQLCPKCELNYINDNEEMCDVCKIKLRQSPRNVRQQHKSRLSKAFNEEFTFRNEPMKYRGKQGFQAYNSDGDIVGIVFMTNDKRRASYGNCELCFYPKYQCRYGEWHRFKTYGQNLKWETLCEHLKNDTEYKCHID